ncbi:unnamed protein product [Callosobruchus maculatus]|uniref:Uncharacterized protein n=1 Tax=Callosobruchus maculatus TaxID=64391 RepID=A0A653DAF6_CALMS|nr:unnamed protein product [Callosobruchus maculatus]
MWLTSGQSLADAFCRCDPLSSTRSINLIEEVLRKNIIQWVKDWAHFCICKTLYFFLLQVTVFGQKSRQPSVLWLNLNCSNSLEEFWFYITNKVRRMKISTYFYYHSTLEMLVILTEAYSSLTYA